MRFKVPNQSSAFFFRYLSRNPRISGPRYANALTSTRHGTRLSRSRAKGVLNNRMIVMTVTNITTVIAFQKNTVNIINHDISLVYSPLLFLVTKQGGNKSKYDQILPGM